MVNLAPLGSHWGIIMRTAEVSEEKSKEKDPETRDREPHSPESMFRVPRSYTPLRVAEEMTTPGSASRRTPVSTWEKDSGISDLSFTLRGAV